MSINREELKRMIDQIPEQDALEVFDFIKYLNKKREKEILNETEIEYLSKDEKLIRQIEKSREDRQNGRVFSKDEGLNYLRERSEDS
ncbi:hypothetical protein [Fredinandcohnia onubensis]|uniref:hypothetical protein n=1 Tax=Fredinandcohnia onubensis TaxID=1571209 RepID=UPI000C0BE7A6|nr:hypothetical protein [Fredinandcohnia onubensis]